MSKIFITQRGPGIKKRADYYKAQHNRHVKLSPNI